MFFVRFNGFLKPTSLQIILQKFINHSVLRSVDCKCETTPICEEKKQYSQPDCKAAIITGGTGAIGFTTANQLLCLNARKVALIDTDICKGREAIVCLNSRFGKNRAFFVKADVTNKMEIEDVLKRIRGELKDVDMIINTFGVWNEKTWESEIHVNLIGTLNINQVAKDILVRPGGIVINIIGIQGIEVFSPSPVLASSFMGVVGYTQSIGHETNSLSAGLRTVALCCGLTESNFTKDVEQKSCCPTMANNLKKYLKDACWQKPEAVGKAVIELIKYAPSGTLWIVEGSRLFSLKLPDLVKTYRNLENQFI